VLHAGALEQHEVPARFGGWTRSLEHMTGEIDVEVVDVGRVDVHGVVYVDVAIRYPDGTTDSTRLGWESIPDDLRAGDRVLAMRVANMVVSIRRAERG
jgi:hypothetical protein